MGDCSLNKDDKNQRGNRENEDSWQCPDSHKHGRSKSASSERDLQASNDEASQSTHVEQLHLRLQQEKSMRMVLEKAMGRPSSSLSPGHRHFAAQAKELITEIEMLEAEVANREHHVLSLYLSIFEETISRASSEQSSAITSPAHHIKQPPKKTPNCHFKCILFLQ